jgi:hypothetical protein
MGREQKGRVRANWTIKLTLNAETREALGVLQAWKSARECTFHFVRAVRLYASLMRGETGVVDEMFPFLRGTRLTPPPSPLPVDGEGGKDEPNSQGGKGARWGVPVLVEAPEKSDEESLDDFMEALGL